MDYRELVIAEYNKWVAVWEQIAIDTREEDEELSLFAVFMLNAVHNQIKNGADDALKEWLRGRHAETD